MQAAMRAAPCETAHRGRGRPPRPVPNWLLDALQATAAGTRATLDRANPANPAEPIGADQLHELRLMLRAGAARLGGRLRVRVTESHVSFWLEPAADDD